MKRKTTQSPLARNTVVLLLALFTAIATACTSVTTTNGATASIFGDIEPRKYPRTPDGKLNIHGVYDFCEIIPDHFISDLGIEGSKRATVPYVPSNCDIRDSTNLIDTFVTFDVTIGTFNPKSMGVIEAFELDGAQIEIHDFTPQYAPDRYRIAIEITIDGVIFAVSPSIKGHSLDQLIELTKPHIKEYLDFYINDILEAEK